MKYKKHTEVLYTAYKKLKSKKIDNLKKLFESHLDYAELQGRANFAKNTQKLIERLRFPKIEDNKKKG